MIKIVYPPGCYGTYLSRCLYEYTSLNTAPRVATMTFDQSGSSHIFRKNITAQQLIWNGHPEDIFWDIENNTSTVIIIPHSDHFLDYWNNHFSKQTLEQVNEFVLGLFSIEDINYKLKTGWGYEQFDTNLPRWVIREFFSKWITDVWADRFQNNYYKQAPAEHSINAEDIIKNFIYTFDTICQRLGLEKTVSNEFISHNHNEFLLGQKFINSQIKCNQCVQDTLDQQNSNLTINTIFDEAYIQHIFRTLGYEIRCNNLNTFPSNTTEMRTLIYAID
jgi:hypothetical protein